MIPRPNLRFRYTPGETPFAFLKALEKDCTVENPILSLICWIEYSVDDNRSFAIEILISLIYSYHS